MSKPNKVFVCFTIKNREHKKLFRFLDKYAPGWTLALRPEQETYQAFCDDYELEDEAAFGYLPKLLRECNWLPGKDDYLGRDSITPSVIWMTPEQAVKVKLFWKGSCERYYC